MLAVSVYALSGRAALPGEYVSRHGGRNIQIHLIYGRTGQLVHGGRDTDVPSCRGLLAEIFVYILCRSYDHFATLGVDSYSN